MCCIKCAHCLGGCLLPLMVFGVLSNILLCFPVMTIVKFEQLSDEVTYFGGIIGCGIIMIFPALTFLTMRAKILKCPKCKCCWPRCLMFKSIIFAALGVAGGSYAMVLAWIAIKKGPKCDIGDNFWDYPFYEWDYLANKVLWRKCKKPVDIVPWNLSLFSIQLAVSTGQVLICAIQLVNGLLGTLCGVWS